MPPNENWETDENGDPIDAPTPTRSAQLGVGVMLGMLSGNRDAAEAINGVLGQRIVSVELVGGERLRIRFAHRTLVLWDDGQSCCEHRYMVCDDDLAHFAGARLVNVEVAPAGRSGSSDESDVHEIQFLRVITDRGVIVCSNHNEHNGYYGGFWINARLDAE